MTADEARNSSRPCPYCQNPHVAINFEVGSGWQIGCGSPVNACIFKPTSVWRKDLAMLVTWWNGIGKGNNTKLK